ncbi:MAG: hypothetical protein HFJ91_08975 [Muribaculaceae bacterium]|nr:hypothetical protein [Muribaculaceae bacterium]
MSKRRVIVLNISEDVVREGLRSILESIAGVTVSTDPKPGVSVSLVVVGAESAESVQSIRDTYGSPVVCAAYSLLTKTQASKFDGCIYVTDSSVDIIAAMTKMISNRDEDRTSSAAPTDELSPRERDVVMGIVNGLSNKEIASEMSVSVNTVMTHRRNIASKLSIHSPAGLTIYAIATGLVNIEDIKNQNW